MRALAAILVACLPAVAAPAAELTASFGPVDAPRRLLVRSTTDLSVLGPVVAAFAEARPDLRVDYEQWGSNDLLAITAEGCATRRPGADLVISSAVHHMVSLVNAGCAATFSSAATEALPPHLRWRDQLWGITREPAVMVYNRDLVEAAEVPRSRFDLLDLLRPSGSRFAGRVATYDIEASGLGFLFAFADSEEATTFGGLMEAFGRSGAVATCCSAEIIDAVIAGEYLVAYNVLGSYALLRARETERLGIVAPEDYTLVLARAAMIPAAAPEPGAAGALVDYLLSGDGRARLEAQNLIVRLGSEDGAAIETAGPVEALERPIALNPTLLVAMDDDKREIFIQRWRDAFPRAAADAVR